MRSPVDSHPGGEAEAPIPKKSSYKTHSEQLQRPQGSTMNVNRLAGNWLQDNEASRTIRPMSIGSAGSPVASPIRASTGSTTNFQPYTGGMTAPGLSMPNIRASGSSTSQPSGGNGVGLGLVGVGPNTGGLGSSLNNTNGAGPLSFSPHTSPNIGGSAAMNAARYAGKHGGPSSGGGHEAGYGSRGLDGGSRGSFSTSQHPKRKQPPEYNLGPPRDLSKRESVKKRDSSSPALDADPDGFGDYLERLPEPSNSGFGVAGGFPDNEHEAVAIRAPDSTIIFSPKERPSIEQTRIPSNFHQSGQAGIFPMERTSSSPSSPNSMREREKRRGEQGNEQTVLPLSVPIPGPTSASASTQMLSGSSSSATGKSQMTPEQETKALLMKPFFNLPGLNMPTIRSDESVPVSARASQLGTLDGWINNMNLGRIETVEPKIIKRVKELRINRALRRDFQNFAQEIKEVFPQETLDVVFQRRKGSSINPVDIKKFAGAGLNHEFIMIGPSGGGGKLLIKVIAVRQETPGASQGEAVETEYLRHVCPDLPRDPNVCFPIASYRGNIKRPKDAHADGGLKYYDIVVLNFVDGCINIRDLVSAFDRAPQEVQGDLYGYMEALIGNQIPVLFHRYYLKHRRKMGDGKADNILMSKDGSLLLCDIGSTFNAVIRPCDKGEFLRSLQPSHGDSPVNLLKEAFERYFRSPPDHATVDLHSSFPTVNQRHMNAELSKHLEVYLSQKGGLLRTGAVKTGQLGAGVSLNVPTLASGLGLTGVSSAPQTLNMSNKVTLQTPANMPTLGAPGGFTFGVNR
ncbi:unnamed protein product [Amoebophrya sp. A25]|nr:unnamed protein product [Amoebophrya sp. A25]|eukprot:GSA25T00002298001.1